MHPVGAEPRPGVHVTPPSGWLNDPVGGLVHRGRQHLFYQYVPSSTRWQVSCHWAHLVGDDLVRWRHLPVALAPDDEDDGIWSGSAVMDRSGPVLLYTSVLDPHLDLGRIALARPVDGDLVGWRKHAGGPVLEPPGDLGLTHFRDPFVWGTTGDWRMVVGAGLRGRGGAVLRYASRDLEDWRFEGVLAEGGAEPGLGDVWECPQYVDLDGEPALIVSVWAGGRLDRVVAARGTDRRQFVPGRWETLGHGGSAYALTTYRDREGRLVGTAWLRHDDPQADRLDWTGALSLPVHITRGDGGRIRLAPHPDVDTLRGPRLEPDGDGVDVTGDGPVDGLADLEVDLPGGSQLCLDTDSAPVLLSAGDGVLIVESEGRSSAVQTTASRPLALRVIVDRGIVEAWTADGRWIALRVPYLRVRRARVRGGGRLQAWRLDPVQAGPVPRG
ncbi:MAG TPA: glycoside hydrolase family 32 protein [Blastococcus sp.]|nr:glycoside hydrolase family 32 protein [Blastococcus sp.]